MSQMMSAPGSGLDDFYAKQERGQQNAAHLADLAHPVPIPQQHLDASWNALSQDKDYISGLRQRAAQQQQAAIEGQKQLQPNSIATSTPQSTFADKPGLSPVLKDADVAQMAGSVNRAGNDLSLDQLRGYAAGDIVAHATASPEYQAYRNQYRQVQGDARYGLTAPQREGIDRQNAQTEAQNAMAQAKIDAPLQVARQTGRDQLAAEQARAQGLNTVAGTNGFYGMIGKGIDAVGRWLSAPGQKPAPAAKGGWVPLPHGGMGDSNTGKTIQPDLSDKSSSSIAPIAPLQRSASAAPSSTYAPGMGGPTPMLRQASYAASAPQGQQTAALPPGAIPNDDGTIWHSGMLWQRKKQPMMNAPTYA